jgi:hypothetical protein
MASHPNRLRPVTTALAAVLLSQAPASLAAQKAVSIPEEIEWTWEVRPPHPDPKLPNVLLLGDSISRAYFPKVTKDLAGVANLYLMASTTSVGDPPVVTAYGRIFSYGRCPLQRCAFQQRHARLGL